MDFDLSKYIGDATMPGQSVTIYQEQYKNYPLIVYALSELMEQEQKKVKHETDKIDLPELTDMQLKFLEYMDSVSVSCEDEEEAKPININNACNELRIRKSELIIWQKTNKLFAMCYELLKEAEAEQAESILWANASHSGNKDSISRMFAIKARKPEYRENAPPPGDTVVNVRISIDDKDFDTSAGFKVAGSSEQDMPL